jgi:hypothetical protein
MVYLLVIDSVTAPLSSPNPNLVKHFNYSVLDIPNINDFSSTNIDKCIKPPTLMTGISSDETFSLLSYA